MRRSGPYNKRLDLQRLSSSTTGDAAGEIDKGDDDNWDTFATRSACIMPAKGSEFWNIDQVDANGVYEISLIYDSLTKTLTPPMRLKLGSRIFNLESVFNVDEHNRVVTLHCVEPK